MTSGGVDWNGVALVAFDVDGTLYAQPPIRRRMATELVFAAFRSGDLGVIRVIRAYRALREQIGTSEAPYDEQALIAETARQSGASAAKVAEVVEQWIGKRPLKHLARHPVPGIHALFQDLSRRGVAIGVVSDYPAQEKLRALNLAADHVVGAGEVPLAYLKPRPEGLLRVIELAKATPEQTIFIGDRIDRDGEAARRAGVRVLIRSKHARPGWLTFRDYHADLFHDLRP